MPDPAHPSAPLAGDRLKGAALERLRHEQALGLDFVPRLQRKPAPPPPVAQASSLQPLAQPSSLPALPPAPRAAPPPAPPAAPAGIDLFTPAIPAQQNREDTDARWKDLEARALACHACVLHQDRRHVVFGCGDRKARLLFVGEAPGEDEDLQGLPFVGRAGQLLNKIIAAMGLKREEVYICNIIKCRPPANRTPLPDEVSTCSPYLQEQIELVAPKVIVALGAPAAKMLLNTTLGIMSIRGHWYNYRGIPVMPTYHPAFVLRRYTEEVRRAVWDDMKQVMAKLKEVSSP